MKWALIALVGDTMLFWTIALIISCAFISHGVFTIDMTQYGEYEIEMVLMFLVAIYGATRIVLDIKSLTGTHVLQNEQEEAR